MGIFAVILAGSWAAYLDYERSNNLDSYSGQVLSLIYQAQNQAMSRMCTQNCDTVQSGENFGVYFDSSNNRIALHRSIVYNPSDEYNIYVNLPDNLSLSQDITDANLVFEKVTGDVRNFDSGNNSFSITEANTGQVKNFSVNKLGIIDVN